MTNVTTGTTTSAQIATITPDLTVIDGKVTTTSLQIAEHFGKRHDTVLRAIRNLECSAEFRLRNFAETVEARVNPSGGAPIESPAYRMTRQGFSFLAMGFTGKEAAQWKESYLETFDRMEAALTQPQALPALAPYSVQPGQTLSAEQAKTLRTMMDDAVKTLPKDKKASFVITGWSKLKAHFDVSYRHIPAAQFHDAVAVLARHIATAGALALPAPEQPQELTAMPQPQTQPPAWVQVSIDWEFVTQAIRRGECSGQALMRLTQASTQRLFVDTCNQSKGWGDEIARQIDNQTPLADLHAIATRATMELELRVVGKQMAMQA